MNELLTYFSDHNSDFLLQLGRHLELTFMSVLLAVGIGIPLGVWASRNKWAERIVLSIAGMFQTIPSIALLGFLIPFLGIGTQPAIVALFLYALLPIVRNTFTGIQEIDPAVREAAKGMGLSDWQLLTKVELPLAVPVIFAGIRTATVINVGVATLAAYIGAGGLGEFIFGGIALNNSTMMLAGALPAAGLALLLDGLLALLQSFPPRRLLQVVAVGLGLTVVAIGGNSLGSKEQLLAAYPPEFTGRPDGLLGLQATYGINLPYKAINSALIYDALNNAEVDVICGYSTDGRISSYGFVVLEDDRRTFPPYQAAPLVRQDRLIQSPEIGHALGRLSGKLDEVQMRDLNNQVDQDNLTPEEVAQNWLKNAGLLEGPSISSNGQTLTIASKSFTESYILAEMFGALIEHHSGFSVEYVHGLQGTKLCFDALLAGEVDLYPEYIGTGLTVLLSPSESELKSLNGDPEAVFSYVKDQFESAYELTWLSPLGFNNTYALLIRGETAKSTGIRSITDLVEYGQ
ncbi:ABC transporter permease/substrate-binding protein [Pontibacter sp. G13]|uniref:ABC transporter permease/substrate-binding protein n=1 Tax=Pontibacter sp. G13 TaxID=3074898 RepID=UPI00288BB077|nr:ABC transporter permease/substrate-binding protein [Pontibacter sp. G13]WNJ17779.1 ABC transporter permease/substrate-binding protein [Pontibacter sp. G13]